MERQGALVRRGYSSGLIISSKTTGISKTRSKAGHDTSRPTPGASSTLEIDRDLAQQSKFALRRAAGVMPDGGLFDFPDECPAPAAISTPEGAAGQLVWLTMPARADNTREVSPEPAENAARYVLGAERVIDSTSNLRVEEEMEVAYPRLAYEIRKTAKPGFVGLPDRPHRGSA